MKAPLTTISTSAPSGFNFDVALSFAGEDRTKAEAIASLLIRKGVRVFYDKYEQADLWGKDLYTHLSEVYTTKARFCVMLLSQHYATKLWTNLERKAAQSRAFTERKEYILPIKIDDTPIPGILNTVGYVDLRCTSIAGVVDLLLNKLSGVDDALKAKPSASSLEKKLIAYARHMHAWSRVREAREHRLTLKARVGDTTQVLESILENNQRVAITGSPGAGKSTFLLQTLGRWCDELEKSIDSGQTVNDAEIGIPFYIELGLLASVDAASSSLQDRLYASVLDILDLPAAGSASSTFEDLIKRYPVVLLLDGLNELPRSQRDMCTRVVFGIERDLAAKGLQLRLRVVVTSRAYSFADYIFEEHGYVLADIAPLESDDIRLEFVRVAKTDKLYFKLTGRFRQFLANPQHLQYVMDALSEQPANLARSRGQLLKICMQRRLRMAKLAKHDEDFASALLQSVGYQTGQIGTFFPMEVVFQTAQAIALRYGLVGREQEILENLFENDILVHNREFCRFSHHSIQQFFAAVDMSKQWRLDDYIGNETLHECLVIMAGLLDEMRLDELLNRTQSNPRLLAYILANVDVPERERVFIDDCVTSFTTTAKRWALHLGRIMKLALAGWVLLLPVPTLYLAAGMPGVTSNWVGVLVTLGAIACWGIPGATIVMTARRSKRILARLKEVELPNLLVSLRYLMANDALIRVRQRMQDLARGMPFGPDEPRRAFVETVTRSITAAMSSSYLTEDEMLDKIGDPLVAAMVCPEDISLSGLSKLLAKSRSLVTGEAVQAIAILQNLYLVNEEQRDVISHHLIQMTQWGRWFSRTRLAAVHACQVLHFSVPTSEPLVVRGLLWLLRIFSRRRWV